MQNISEEQDSNEVAVKDKKRLFKKIREPVEQDTRIMKQKLDTAKQAVIDEAMIELSRRESELQVMESVFDQISEEN